MTDMIPDNPKKSGVPGVRVRRINRAPVQADREWVVYWMISARRSRFNFALERAADWARELQRPLLILEALRTGYRWASDRIHAFVIQGMIDNRKSFREQAVTYYPYVEPHDGAGKGLLAALGRRAALVVTDDFPCIFVPRMIQSAGEQLDCCLEAVDSNGVYPLRDTDRVFARAHDFRRHLQKNLLPHLAESPKPNPLERMRIPRLDKLPAELTKRWPVEDLDRWDQIDDWAVLLSEYPIDHAVAPVATCGGSYAAGQRLGQFVKRKLEQYADRRNQPEQDVSSGLSPYLHFGHISSHEVFDRITRHEGWNPARVSDKTSGSARGWWNLSESAESFLDELITWRELGYNMCAHRANYDRYESLPEWARRTLAQHADDPRDHLYDLDEFASAQTHDPLWNAAQRQLSRTGVIHNYLRMLWGKKILEWTPSPQVALETMIELNNRFAIDGRNPNSYSGIFWVLGRYDRAWGPERPVYGKIRYMSSKNTARKVRIRQYLEKYGSDTSPQPPLPRG